jgi:hypothetical protein
MIRIAGCELTSVDVEQLVTALSSSDRALAHEVAAAIRWGAGADLDTDRLECDMRNAILEAVATLDAPRLGVVQLRTTLEQSVLAEPKLHRIKRRIHNPRRRECECLSDCWCKRSVLGQMVRWYVPSKYHSPLSAGGGRAEVA